MARPASIVSDHDGLASLIERLPLLFPGQDTVLRFALPQLSPGENAILQERANRMYAACGCGTGATVSIAALALYAVYIHTGGSPTVSPIEATVGGACIFMAAGAAGKAAGIVTARLRLRRLLQGLLAEST